MTADQRRRSGARRPEGQQARGMADARSRASASRSLRPVLASARAADLHRSNADRQSDTERAGERIGVDLGRVAVATRSVTTGRHLRGQVRIVTHVRSQSASQFAGTPCAATPRCTSTTSSVSRCSSFHDSSSRSMSCTRRGPCCSLVAAGERVIARDPTPLRGDAGKRERMAGCGGWHTVSTRCRRRWAG